MDKRLENLRHLIAKNKLDAVLVSSIPSIIYLTNFSGFHAENRDGYVIVTKNNNYFITNALYIEAAKKNVKSFELIQVTTKKRYPQVFEELIEKDNIKNLGLDLMDLKAFEYETISKLVKKTTHFDLSELRSIKEASEIKLIKKACLLGDKTYAHILKYVRMNITEKELAHQIDNFIRAHGAEPSFRTVVAFGENAALPHHLPSIKKLKKNMFILMDFGVKLNNYCSDMTRTIFFGKAQDEQKKAYQAVFAAEKKAIEYIINSLTENKKPISTKVDATARDYMEKNGYPPFNHSSHGIGLEVHEDPHISRSQDPLENGMVFSIEPGVYLPGKFGIRIEDIFAIENNKLIPLTLSPKELIEI